jgi:parallel beta-helix repeat protein
VSIAPGSDIQAAVNAHPAGTAFCLKAGVYSRTSAITPKSGNSFTGEYGAVIDGSNWSTTDANQGLFRSHNQDIDDVVIRNLVIRNSPQRGIHAYKDHSDRWIIENNEIHDNRLGISHGNFFQIRRNVIRHNWQFGIGGFRSTGSVIEGNEFTFNAARFRDFPGNSGTSKWAAGVTNTIVRGNVVRDNYWHGIWFDGHHSGILIENNVVQNNGLGLGADGILHEIGGQTVIRNNTISGQHRGIHISASRDTEVYGNLISQTDRPIQLFQDGTRISESELRNNLIRDNTVRVPSASNVPGVGTLGASLNCMNLTSTQCSAYSTSRDNRFQGNAYFVPDTAKRWWYWNNTSMLWSDWRAAGQDTTGSMEKL